MSPKGDPAGFVKVLDDKRLVIPDRPGNRRADTFENLVVNPFVGLIFIVPGKNETLRINGEARITRDETLRAAMAVNGKEPDFAIVVGAPARIVRYRTEKHAPSDASETNVAEGESS